MLFTLDNARTGNQKQVTGTDVDIADFERRTQHSPFQRGYPETPRNVTQEFAIGFFGALQRTRKPMALIAGGSDDQFYADRYAPTLQPAKPDLTVELVPGLDHVDMLMKPAALAALRRTFDTMPL